MFKIDIICLFTFETLFWMLHRPAVIVLEGGSMGVRFVRPQVYQGLGQDLQLSKRLVVVREILTIEAQVLVERSHFEDFHDLKSKKIENLASGLWWPFAETV